MSRLIYITNTSLDGYIEDASGEFNWTNPPAGVFDFITELIRPFGTFLYGRRLYETMRFWAAPVDDYEPQQREFARVWQSHEKIVFSRTLTEVPTSDTRVERDFTPDRIRELKRESNRDIGIGGAQLASLALNAGLIDECHFFVYPVLVGGGKPALQTEQRHHLELLDMRRFGTEVVYVRYRVLEHV